MALETAVIVGFTELAKLALQTYFNYAKLAGKTEEEIEEVYRQEKAGFIARNPADLPDVPPDA